LKAKPEKRKEMKYIGAYVVASLFDEFAVLAASQCRSVSDQLRFVLRKAVDDQRTKA
jgi:hypothetical protein